MDSEKRQRLIDRWGKGQTIGTSGLVRLVDCMGDDSAIVQAARVSYGHGTKTVSQDRDLIRYLVKHGHGTPLEMAEIKLHIRVPMDTWRQMIRQRTASVNEYSTRYSIAIKDKALTPVKEWRLQSKSNKQGSAGFLIDQEGGVSKANFLSEQELKLHEICDSIYEERLEAGIAREQARKDLPLSTYTEAYWKIDARNLLNFLNQRLNPHAQKEIREFAVAISNIVKEWLPLLWEAFEEYVLNAVVFSASEMQALREWMNNSTCSLWEGEPDLKDLSREDRIAWLDNSGLKSKKGRIEFWNKIRN